MIHIVIFSYGDFINSSHNWVRFNRDCIFPNQTDRAGASTDVIIRDIMRQLQERWRCPFYILFIVIIIIILVYISNLCCYIQKNINRRIWATEISRLSRFEQ